MAEGQCCSKGGDQEWGEKRRKNSQEGAHYKIGSGIARIGWKQSVYPLEKGGGSV